MISRVLQSSAKYLLLAVLLLLIVSFQNCSGTNVPVKFTSLSSAGAGTGSAAAESGNGGTYDGKPIGTYIRRSHEGCSLDNNWIGVLKLGETNADLVNDLCIALNYVLDLADQRFDFSAFNPDFIGLNTAIFERSETTTPAANAPYVDLWCHYQDSQFGLDVVVKTDSSNKSQSVVYVGDNLSSANPSARKFNSKPTIKVATTNLLTTSTSDGTMSTQVDLSNPNDFKHPGQTTIRLDDKNLRLEMSCRVANNKPAILVDPNNALAVYQMDRALGPAANNSVILDSSRNSTNLILHNKDNLGAKFVAGLIGNALSFDGNDDNVDLTPVARSVTNDFTFSAWVLPSTLINDESVLFGIFDTVNFLPQYYNLLRVGFGLCNPPGDITADKYQLTMDIGGPCYGTGVTVVDGQWHMVTLAVKGTTATLYLDAVQVAQHTIGTTLAPSSNIWALGQDWDSATSENDRYNGLIDEVTVWDRALEQADVLQVLKNSGQ